MSDRELEPRRMERSFEYSVFDTVNMLPTEDRELVNAATEAMKNAHNPYSGFFVGAALRLKNGDIVTGCNQENASYGATVCAERTALWNAGTQGHKRDVIAIAVTGKGKDFETTEPVAPCGMCRQVIKEYEDASGEEMTIIMAGTQSPVYKLKGIESILPFAFGPKSLGIDISEE